MHTIFTTLVGSRDRYALVMQIFVLDSLVTSLLAISSSPFSYAYDVQCC